MPKITKAECAQADGKRRTYGPIEYRTFRDQRQRRQTPRRELLPHHKKRPLQGARRCGLLRRDHLGIHARSGPARRFCPAGQERRADVRWAMRENFGNEGLLNAAEEQAIDLDAVGMRLPANTATKAACPGRMQH